MKINSFTLINVSDSDPNLAAVKCTGFVKLGINYSHAI